MYADLDSGKLLSAQTSRPEKNKWLQLVRGAKRDVERVFTWGAQVTCAGRQGYAWEDAAQDTSSRSYFQADTGFVRGTPLGENTGVDEQWLISFKLGWQYNIVLRKQQRSVGHFLLRQACL